MASNQTVTSEENSVLFATYAYQDQADAAVRTYNLYVTDGTGRTMRAVRAGAGVYHVYLDAPGKFALVRVAA